MRPHNSIRCIAAKPAHMSGISTTRWAGSLNETLRNARKLRRNLSMACSEKRSRGNYTAALDPARELTAHAPVDNARWRVRDNLLGGPRRKLNPVNELRNPPKSSQVYSQPSTTTVGVPSCSSILPLTGGRSFAHQYSGPSASWSVCAVNMRSTTASSCASCALRTRV